MPSQGSGRHWEARRLLWHKQLPSIEVRLGRGGLGWLGCDLTHFKQPASKQASAAIRPVTRIGIGPAAQKKPLAEADCFAQVLPA